jgi:inner membrane protein
VHRRLGPRTWLYGALGGVAADLDLVIRSPTNPLLGLEYHRHFTHSLAFVPLGGLLVALPWLIRGLAARRRGDESVFARAKWIWAATTIGFATHGLLDAFTAYGTMLWWPFAETRVGWNVISIIDPIYTVALIIGTVVCTRQDKPRAAAIGLVLSSLYMALCGLQHARAATAQSRIADARGHVVERAAVFPLLGTNLTWRAVYRFQGQIHIDRIVTPWWRAPQYVSVGVLNLAPAEPQDGWRGADPSAAYRLMHWFSQEWLVAEPGERGPKICDARLSRSETQNILFFCLERDSEDGKLFRPPIEQDVGVARLKQFFEDPAGQRPVPEN